MKTIVLLLFLVLGTTFNVSAQNEAESHRIVIKTRLQVLFGDLEDQWFKAAQRNDKTVLHRLTSENLNIWTPTPPGDPMPWEDWEKIVFARKLQSFQIRQIAVRALSPEIAVADFVLTEIFDHGGKPQTENHFVVDVWVKTGAGENWQCTDRYWWDATSVSHPSGGQRNVKPTGKD